MPRLRNKSCSTWNLAMLSLALLHLSGQWPFKFKPKVRCLFFAKNRYHGFQPKAPFCLGPANKGPVACWDVRYHGPKPLDFLVLLTSANLWYPKHPNSSNSLPLQPRLPGLGASLVGEFMIRTSGVVMSVLFATTCHFRVMATMVVSLGIAS